MANKSVEKPDLNFILPHRAPNAIWSDGGRNLIGWRTQSDRTADGERWLKFIYYVLCSQAECALTSTLPRKLLYLQTPYCIFVTFKRLLFKN